MLLQHVIIEVTMFNCRIETKRKKSIITRLKQIIEDLEDGSCGGGWEEEERSIIDRLSNHEEQSSFEWEIE